jgi:hypothetical protein
MFRSFIGIALTPVWWAAYLCIVLQRQASNATGAGLLGYKQQVKGRIIPGLPV